MLTYYHDAKPILDTKCVNCHSSDGIGPFSYETYADLQPHLPQMKAAIAGGLMPPWPPDGTCNSYAFTRQLTADETTTLTEWFNQGAPEGDPSTVQPDVPTQNATLSRIDMTLQIPQPFTPTIYPDTYQCFVIPWTPTTMSYITGYGAIPGNPQIVHHSILYKIPPASVASVQQQLDPQNPSAGYSCFGGPGGSGSLGWIGAWVPGSQGADFPAGTGVPVEPGSVLVIQIHYNLNNVPMGMIPTPDQTKVVLKVDSTVQKPAYVMPFTDPSWVRQKTMDIPPNQSDVMHEYAIDPSPYMGTLTGGIIPSSTPFTIYTAGLHMHLLGTHAMVDVQHAGGQDDCLLRINHWDFHWQGAYQLAQTVTFNPGDQLHIQCHWDNTMANQPIFNGMQQMVADRNWGEGSTDEMCLGILYMTQ